MEFESETEESIQQLHLCRNLRLEEVEKSLESKNAIPLPSGHFAEDTLVDQKAYRRRGSDIGAVELSLGKSDGNDGLLEDEVEKAHSVRVRRQCLPAFFAKRKNRSSRRCRVATYLFHAGQEKLQPSLPIAIIANRRQTVIVLRTMRFQINTQVEQGLFQDVAFAEEKRHEQSSDSPVAVQERMDGLELRVGESAVNQRRQRLAVVKKLLECVERIMHRGHRRRDESRIRQGAVRRPDPVLRTPELARITVRTAYACHESRVNLPNESKRERKLVQPAESCVERAHVVDNFFNIVGHGRACIGFVLQDVFESALGALNL